MGLLGRIGRGIWDGLASIGHTVSKLFAPKPKPIVVVPEPDIIERTVGEIWRAVTGEAKEEWREEKAETEQRIIDDVFAGEWEKAKEEGLYTLTDDDVRGIYREYLGR